MLPTGTLFDFPWLDWLRTTMKTGCLEFFDATFIEGPCEAAPCSLIQPDPVITPPLFARPSLMQCMSGRKSFAHGRRWPFVARVWLTLNYLEFSRSFSPIVEGLLYWFCLWSVYLGDNWSFRIKSRRLKSSSAWEKKLFLLHGTLPCMGYSCRTFPGVCLWL